MQRRIIVLGVLLAFAASPLLAAGKLFDGEEKAFGICLPLTLG